MNLVTKTYLGAILLPVAVLGCSSSGASGDNAKDAGERAADASGGTGRPTGAGSSDSGAPPRGPTDAGTTDATVANGGDGSAGDASADAGPKTPAPAAAAGFTHLVFEDDFTTDDTIAPTLNAGSGYKWYWSFVVQSEPTPWKVQTGATAASITDAGAGANASDAGGILTLFGPGENNSAIVTVPGWALSAADASVPPEGQGNWQHAYFEAYLQTRIDGNTSTDPNSGWPAFWSWSVQGLKNFGYGLSPIQTATSSEIDFFETYGTVFGQTPGNWTATMHQWGSGGVVNSDGANNKTDGGWHTYGCLWTSTGAGVGQVKFYYDGAQVDNTVDSGTGQTQSALEGLSQFLVLGSGNGWNLNVDWVRVWQ